MCNSFIFPYPRPQIFRSMAKQQEAAFYHETACEYGRKQKCFYDHQAAPFRFKDQARLIQSTSGSVQPNGLIQQDGLVATSLPYPEPGFDSEQLDPPSSSRYLMLDQDKQRQNLWQLPPIFSEIYLPNETFDLGSDLMEDMRQYTIDVRLKRNCSLSGTWLPLCPTDSDKDEGLIFPPTSSRWQSLALRELESEVIDVSEEAKQLAQDEEELNSLLPKQGLANEDLKLQKASPCPRVRLCEDQLTEIVFDDIS